MPRSDSERQFAIEAATDSYVAVIKTAGATATEGYRAAKKNYDAAVKTIEDAAKQACSVANDAYELALLAADG